MSEPSSAPRVLVAGSERRLPAGAVDVGPADPAAPVAVTVVVRAKKPSLAHAAELIAQTPYERRYLSRAQLADEYGAADEDLTALERFAEAAGLRVTGRDRARRSVWLGGSAADVGAAFGTALRTFEIDGNRFRGRTGSLTVPGDVAPLVAGVFGLDARPQARAHFRRRVQIAAAGAVSYTPLAVAQAYAFPAAYDGSGQTIAIVELGGGYAASDLDGYFSKLGLNVPTIVSVPVDGGANVPGQAPGGADAEVLLDIEVAGSIAPGAKFVVYFAPNTDQGFLDAVTAAVHDTANHPTILSISWGGPESTWTQQDFTNFDASFADAVTIGMSVFVAAGDSGSSDGVSDGLAHVDFPASSPHVHACGGTTLHASGGAIASEVVWNDGSAGGATGGGISTAFPLPVWQQNAGVPPSVNPGGATGRGVPDVAGDADPQTGYDVDVDGSATVIGGTSAVAPLWAALVARLNQAAGRELGFLNATLYANPTALNDITQGNNGAYSAGPGWDACTGLGSPQGAALLALLAPSTVATADS